MSDIYLSLAETPAVVTLSQPVVSGVLSSTVTVGNTVTVALDANSLSALENVTVTVGAAVSVSNFPASQVVTGSVAVTTMPAISISSVSISNFPSTQTIAGTVTANAGGDFGGAIEIVHDVSNVSHKIAVQLYGDNGSAIGVSNNPLPISGTVTANGGNFVFSESEDTSSAKGVLIGFENDASTEFRKVTDAQPLPISISAINNTGGFSGSLPVSGTVTVSNQQTLISYNGQITATAGPAILARGEYSGTGWTTLEGVFTEMREEGVGIPIGLPSGVTSLGVSVSNSVTIGSLPAISGTVTVGNAQQLADALIDQTSFYAPLQVSIQGAGADVQVLLPKGALTTRFGSVATANLAFITSAVTNTSRKYLLAQNISAGTVTIGIGFSPTTTQGIQLPAGGGLTFDAFCPTGAVYWLGAVTGAAFTILEG